MNQEFLYEKLRAHLIEQGMRPGDTIESEVALARRFGVSRHKMRDILGAMTQAGILERAPRRGTVIRGFDTLSLSDHIRFQFEVAHFNIAQFKEARVLVECAILPLVIQRVTPARMAAIVRCNEQMAQHPEDPEVLEACDREFHLLLFEACGNEVLNAFSGVLTSLFRRTAQRRQYWSAERVRNVLEEHTAIVERIRAGDAEGAISAMQNHLGYGRVSKATKEQPSG